MPWPSAKNIVKSQNLHFTKRVSVPVGGTARTVGTTNPKPTSSPGRTKRNFSHTLPKEGR